MRLASILLLGSAAGFAAVAGAQAADLPSRKSAPVAYVKICDAYGAGFFYIPGTDTCLKVGGYVRAEWQYTPGKAAYSIAAPNVAAGGLVFSTALNYVNALGATVAAGTASQVAGAQDTTGSEVRGRIELDARTPTAFGTVRTAVRLRAANTSGIRNTNPVNNGNWSMATASTTGITIEAAYVQWAGFTFGVAPENYAMMPSMMYNSNGWAGFPNGMKQLAYTATFGGGFSATLAIEDRTDFSNATPVTAPSGTTMGYGSTYGHSPLTGYHLVGNIRVDQSWGFAAIHGMIGNTSLCSGNGLLQVNGGCAGAIATLTGAQAIVVAPIDTLAGTSAGYIPAFGSKTYAGWAIGSTVKFNLPMIAAGDAVWFTANYAHGLLGALMSAGSMNSFATASGRRVAGGITNITQPLVYTGGLGTAASPFTVGVTTGWNVAMAATHYWAPQWRSNFAAAYVQINPPTVAATALLPFQWGKSSTWAVQGSLIYSPAKDFDIGLEVQYLSNKSSIQNLALSTGNYNPLTATGLKNNNISTHLRIERAF